MMTIIAGMLFTILWISSGMDEVITARFMTFIVAGLVAIVTTWLFPGSEKSETGIRDRVSL